jgi:hypothetical protein
MHPYQVASCSLALIEPSPEPLWDVKTQYLSPSQQGENSVSPPWNGSKDPPLARISSWCDIWWLPRSLWWSYRSCFWESEQQECSNLGNLTAVGQNANYLWLVISQHVLFSNQPTPWSRTLIEKLPVAQLLKNFPTFYGSWRPISWARSIQSVTSYLRSTLILFTHLRLGLPVVSFLLAFQPISYMHSSSPHSCNMPCSSHLPWLGHSNYTWWGV